MKVSAKVDFNLSTTSRRQVEANPKKAETSAFFNISRPPIFNYIYDYLTESDAATKHVPGSEHPRGWCEA